LGKVVWVACENDIFGKKVRSDVLTIFKVYVLHITKNDVQPFLKVFCTIEEQIAISLCFTWWKETMVLLLLFLNKYVGIVVGKIVFNCTTIDLKTFVRIF
jgi:hypothetical protein